MQCGLRMKRLVESESTIVARQDAVSGRPFRQPLSDGDESPQLRCGSARDENNEVSSRSQMKPIYGYVLHTTGRLMAQHRHARVVIVIMTLGAVLHAQPALEHLRRADDAYRARQGDEAYLHLLRAIAMDPINYEAQWKASRSEVDLAEATGRSTNDRLLDAALMHAQAAIRLHPERAEGHIALARAMRHRARGAGVRDRARFAEPIHSAVLAALAAHPHHPDALHALGMWHADLMRMGVVARRFARSFLGADLFELANWDEAQQLLEDAVRNDPGRIVHRLELAAIYADRGDKARARQLYMWIASAQLVDPNDDLYKRQAADRSQRLGT